MNALALTVPPELVEAIAMRVADELDRRGRLAGTITATPWLTIDEAADYLRCAKQRLYDLASSGELTPHKDGRRSLYRREQLDAHLEAA